MVKTNYKELTMKFDLLGKAIKLQRNPQMAESAISGSGLRKLVARHEVAYFCQLVCDAPTPASSITNEIDITELFGAYHHLYGGGETRLGQTRGSKGVATTQINKTDQSFSRANGLLPAVYKPLCTNHKSSY